MQHSFIKNNCNTQSHRGTTTNTVSEQTCPSMRTQERDVGGGGAPPTQFPLWEWLGWLTDTVARFCQPGTRTPGPSKEGAVWAPENLFAVNGGLSNSGPVMAGNDWTWSWAKGGGQWEGGRVSVKLAVGRVSSRPHGAACLMDNPDSVCNTSAWPEECCCKCMGIWVNYKASILIYPLNLILRLKHQRSKVLNMQRNCVFELKGFFCFRIWVQ